MRKPFNFFMLIGLFCVVVASSSCFDIEETYHFRKDGSGTAMVKLDMSQMIDMMASFAGSLDSTGEADESVDQLFKENEAAANLGRIPGISKVKDLNDKESGIIGYSYEFASVEALNNALVATEGSLNMDELMGSESETGGESDAENRFVKKGKKLQRIYVMPPQEQDDEDTDEEAEQYKQMAEMMFADHYYTIEYIFDQDVKKVSKNKNAAISGRKVTIKEPLTKLMKGEAELGALIKLK
jgi:hypothetical protein